MWIEENLFRHSRCLLRAPCAGTGHATRYTGFIAHPQDAAGSRTARWIFHQADIAGLYVCAAQGSKPSHTRN